MKSRWIVLSAALLAVAAGCAPAFRGPAPTMRQAPHRAAAEERANGGHEARVAENPTKAVKLHNREAAEMADELNALYGAGSSEAPAGSLQGKVKVDAAPGSNSVIITTEPIYMERVVKLVKELDAEEGNLATSGKGFAEAYQGVGRPAFLVLANRQREETSQSLPESTVEETIGSLASSRGARLAELDAARLAELRGSEKAEGLPDSVGVLVKADYYEAGGRFFVTMKATDVHDSVVIGQVARDCEYGGGDGKAVVNAFIRSTTAKLLGEMANYWRNEGKMGAGEAPVPAGGM
jgi:hypothetical protein